MRNIFIGIAISCSLVAPAAQAQTPTFTAAGVLNAASLTAGPIAPGMAATIEGSNLGDPNFPGNCISVTPTPATCNAVTVLVNGAPAPKMYDSATQLTFQVPFSLTGTTATIQVTSNLSGSTLSSAVVTVPAAAVAPALFTCSTGNCAAGTGYYYDATQSGLGAEYSRAVLPGDTVILFGTGFGVTNPAVATGALAPASGAATMAIVTMTINNQNVPVSFAGLEPGTFSGAEVGYDEVAFTVPSTLTVPSGQTSAAFPMVVTVGATASAAVNLIVTSPPVTITSVSPNPVPLSANPQTVTFTGTGFESGLLLKLETPGLQQLTVSGASINFISATQFTAQITTGTTAGSWGALVENPDGTESSVFNFTASGAGGTNLPTISYIITTSSGSTLISQNDWIEVHGTNLSQVATTWSNANFANGLPTTLGNLTATVNGKSVAIYYVSPTQVNILTPLDTATGQVAVVVNTPSGSATFNVTEVPASPAFLVLDVAGDVAALHSPSLTLLGPPSLSQGGATFTPANPGETVAIYATGFGQTSPAFTNQLADTGPFPLNLATLPTVTIGNLPAVVSFAGLVGPGLYQINLTVPASAPAGVLPIVAMYNGVSTQNTAVITVK